MKRVKLSIVMATYNRADLLEKQLNAFQNQSTDLTEFEVVIINDGSSDETANLLYVWSQKMANLKYSNQENAGPAVARNNGVKHASGEIIAFTDDDCIVDLNWVESILTAFEQNEVKVVQGLTYTDKSKRTPLTHQIENLNWNNVIPTCNAAYKKDFFEELGGFEVDFPFPHNEDTDLAWRVHERTKVLFDSNVKVYHPPVKVRFSSQLKRMRMLRSEFLLFRRNQNSYKNWRSANPWKTIYWDVFFKHQLLNLKFHLGFYTKPGLMIQGVALSIGWWIYLVLLFPVFAYEHYTQEIIK